MKKYFPHLCVLASGVLWGLIGIFNRRLTAAGFSVASIVLIRNLGSMLVLGALFVLKDPKIFRIRAKHIPIFLGTGVVSVLLFTLCYFSCQRLCSLAVAAVLLYTSPAFVVIFSAILWKDKITKRKLLALLLAFLGCTFVTGLWSGDAAVTAWGALLGVASGLFYGLYSIFGKLALKRYRSETMTLYSFLFGAASMCFMCDAKGAVRLLFAEDPLLELQKGCDLFQVAEIKRPKENSLEIKFFDRMKALEKLEQLREGEQCGTSDFYHAVIGGMADAAADRGQEEE